MSSLFFDLIIIVGIIICIRWVINAWKEFVDDFNNYDNPGY